MVGYDLAVEGSWQNYCTSILLDCISKNSVISAKMWNEKKVELEKIKRVIIADAEFVDADMRGYIFSRCYFIRCEFSGCRLDRSVFRYAIIRSSRLIECSISSADFGEADLAEDVSLISISYNDRTNFSVRSGRFPSKIDVGLRDIAENEWRKQDIKRNKSRGALYRILVRLLGYGARMDRIIYISLSIIAAFTALYASINPIKDDPYSTISIALKNSLRYFLSLSDPYEVNGGLISVAGIMESALGLIMLAVLISVISRRLILVR